MCPYSARHPKVVMAEQSRRGVRKRRGLRLFSDYHEEANILGTQNPVL